MDSRDSKPAAPGGAIRAALKARDWTQEDLARILGRPLTELNKIIMGKTAITPRTAVALAAAFGDNPQAWMDLDSAYRLSQVQADHEDVQKRAKLHALAPIRDMQRRGWIEDVTEADALESQLKRFFRTSDLDNLPELSVATRRTASAPALTAAQRAWCFRARQLAEALQVAPFVRGNLRSVRSRLRECAMFAKSIPHVPRLLSNAGIRLVIVEPLPGIKVDGAAFWLDDRSPAIALSLRYDRIDAFWFTLMHEFAHIEDGDAASVDSDLSGETPQLSKEKEDHERIADERAAASLIPAQEVESFVRRFSPLYAKPRIIQFAHRIRIHPGIIVGRLQHIGEIGYQANREMLVRIRGIITEVALTDGWGRVVGTGIM